MAASLVPTPFLVRADGGLLLLEAGFARGEKKKIMRASQNAGARVAFIIQVGTAPRTRWRRIAAARALTPRYAGVMHRTA